MEHGGLWAFLWVASQLVIGVLGYMQGRKDERLQQLELWRKDNARRQKASE
jgi:hypothetical protein